MVAIFSTFRMQLWECAPIHYGKPVLSQPRKLPKDFGFSGAQLRQENSTTFILRPYTYIIMWFFTNRRIVHTLLRHSPEYLPPWITIISFFVMFCEFFFDRLKILQFRNTNLVDTVSNSLPNHSLFTFFVHSINMLFNKQHMYLSETIMYWHLVFPKIDEQSSSSN